ncbi:hypothetical protein BD410DRAFT_779368 [Rickenella mellea]|uniref:Uncharacterized protein n=1 Tax=Rickenella mellea TaxID=50990 RepID=A0A4R5XG04_9AGAM|nr:hypothetical protein BD410DRAFT_779368 [Rickenella mellea]
MRIWDAATKDTRLTAPHLDARSRHGQDWERQRQSKKSSSNFHDVKMVGLRRLVFGVQSSSPLYSTKSQQNRQKLVPCTDSV